MSRIVVLPHRRNPARVEPKRLADIKLTTKDKGDNKDRRQVTVQGAVTPRTNGQDLRVDLRGSDLSHGSVIVTTGLRGTFDAQFVIDQLERPKGKKDPRERVRYEVQAHIINASELAPTSSNVLRIG